MKRKIFKVKDNINNQKKLYLVLIGLALLSFLSGLCFVFVLDNDNLKQINDTITSFFSNREWEDISVITSFLNIFIYIIAIWVLGISIIGLPFSIMILGFKSFLSGFSISSIIYTYGFKGLLIIFIEYIPSAIFSGILLILVTFYSISFSIKLFNYLFLKKQVNFKETMKKYVKIFVICFVYSIILCLYNTFFIPFLLSAFI